MALVSIAPWLGSELAVVADSGLWIGHCFALAAGNHYKGESRNAAILQSTKNAQVPKNRGMKFGCWAYSSHFYWGLVFRNHIFIKNGVNLHGNPDLTLTR